MIQIKKWKVWEKFRKIDEADIMLLKTIIKDKNELYYDGILGFFHIERKEYFLTIFKTHEKLFEVLSNLENTSENIFFVQVKITEVNKYLKQLFSSKYERIC